MWRVTREGLKGRKASTAENMKFSGKKIIAIKSSNILPYFNANLCFYQNLPLSQLFCLFSEGFGKLRYVSSRYPAQLFPVNCIWKGNQ